MVSSLHTTVHLSHAMCYFIFVYDKEEVKSKSQHSRHRFVSFVIYIFHLQHHKGTINILLNIYNDFKRLLFYHNNQSVDKIDNSIFVIA